MTRYFILLILLTMLFAPAQAGEPEKISSFKKSAATSHAYFNVNRINNRMLNNGQYVDYTYTSSSGLEWPKGSLNFIDFASGIWIAGKTRSDRAIRTACTQYESEFMPGKILPNGMPDDPALPKYRWYKISSADLQNPGDDYLNWPVADGAPVDASGKPLLLGDQTLWCVFNDADSSGKPSNVFSSDRMGAEIQMTVWGYERPDQWGDMMFVKAKIIHKGAETFDSTFIGLWDDPDLGDAADDYIGCDTLLNLGYAYNADNNDQAYGIAPPAIGRVFLQTMIVPSAGDTALVSGKRILGFKNLPLYAFYPNFKSSYPLADPENLEEVFNSLSGKGQNGSPFIDPGTGKQTRFFFPGDPELNMEWVEGDTIVWSDTNRITFQPGDRRFLMSSGPFTFAPGDTQEIVFAVLVARGTSNLNSVTKLKELTRLAQQGYDNNFNTPQLSRLQYGQRSIGGTATEFTVSSNIRGLTGVSQARLELTPEIGSEDPFTVELNDDGNYGDGMSNDEAWGGTLTVANRKYPYQADLIIHSSSGTDTVKRIIGSVQLRPSPKLTNWRVVWENGQQDRKLNNGELVYLAFDIENIDKLHAINLLRIVSTNFSWGDTIGTEAIAPGGILRLDSPLLTLLQNGTESRQSIGCIVEFDNHRVSTSELIPVSPWYPHSVWKDTLPVTAIRGISGTVAATIADPSILTGHTYLVSFYQNSSDSITQWRLIDQTTGEAKLERGSYQKNWWDATPVIDGIKYQVTEPARDFIQFVCVANGTGFLEYPDGAASYYWGYSFLGPQVPNLWPAVGLPSLSNGGRWGIHTGLADSLFGVDYDSFKLSVTRNGANWPRVIPHDFEIRFTSSGGKARMHYTSGAIVDVPFEIWNTGRGTPDDASDDYRLIPYVDDRDTNGIFNLCGIDHPASGGDNDPETDWIDFREPLNKTPGQFGYNAWIASGGNTLNAGLEVLHALVLMNWNGGSVSDSTWPANVNQMMPASGTIYRIVTAKTNLPGDSVMIASPSNANGELVSYSLLQNYPNPFNLSTRIRFSIQKETHVGMEIFDILGRRVRVLKNEVMRPGSYEVDWNGTNDGNATVSSGVYFFRMKADQFVKTVKMIVVK